MDVKLKTKCGRELTLFKKGKSYYWNVTPPILAYEIMVNGKKRDVKDHYQGYGDGKFNTGCVIRFNKKDLDGVTFNEVPSS